MSIWRGLAIACVTAFLVIALKTTRSTSVPFFTALRPVSASSRCHEIASPSRSGSVARISFWSSFSASAIARMCLALSGATSHFIWNAFSVSTEPSFAGRSRTCPYDASTV